MIDKGPKIGDLLVQAGLIDQMQLRAALGHQKRWGGKIGKVIVDLGFIEEDAMLRFLSERFKLKAVNLLRSRITAQTFETVPETLAKKYQVVPVVVREIGGKKTIVLAMNDPSDLRAIDEVTFLTGAKIEPVLATDSAIAKVLSRYGDFTPDPKEYHFQEQATPSQLRQQREDQPPKESAPAPARPAPPPPRRPTPSVSQVPTAEEEFEIPPDDDLELIKGEVTMLKATKPGVKRFQPLRPRPDSSPILGRPDTHPKTQQAPGSPLLGRTAPQPAPEPMQIQEEPPTLEPPEIVTLEPEPADNGQALPDIAPLPDSFSESDVLLQQSAEPPEMDAPPLPVDFLDDASRAASGDEDSDHGLEIPDGGEEMQLADAYEFIPPKPEPEFEPPDRPALGSEPTEEPPIEEAGPPPFDADSLPPSLEEPPPAAEAPVPPEVEWGHAGDDFFSMPVPGGMTDQPEAMPDIPSIAPLGEAMPSPFDEEWPTVAVAPSPEPELPTLEIVSPENAAGFNEIPAMSVEPEPTAPPLPPDLFAPETQMEAEPFTPPPILDAPTEAASAAPGQDDQLWGEFNPQEHVEPETPPPAPADESPWEELQPPPVEPLPKSAAEVIPDEPMDLWDQPVKPEPAADLAVPPEEVPVAPPPDVLWEETPAPSAPEPALWEESPVPSAPEPAPVDDLWAAQANDNPDDLWAAEPKVPPPADIHHDLPPLPDLEWSHEAPKQHEPIPEAPPPDWGHLDETPASEPADVAEGPLPWEDQEPEPVPTMADPGMDLMVEEIGSLKDSEPEPVSLPPTALPFEAPPPEPEEMPVIEALPLRGDPGESKPDFEVISEPAPFDEPPDLPPAFSTSLDEEVTEIPAFDRTVLKMEPVTVGEEIPAAFDLPETVLLPAQSPIGLPAPPPPPVRPAPPPMPPAPPRPPSPAAQVETPTPPAPYPPDEPTTADAPIPQPASDLGSPGEIKLVQAAQDESPDIESIRAELERLENLGDEFLDTRAVRDKLSRISELEREVKSREFQFDDLLSLMMKKELGEITQELFMKELVVLKKKADDTRRKGDE